MRKISTAELKPGMKVVETGLSRVRHPYLYTQEGWITSAKQAKAIRELGYRETYIEEPGGGPGLGEVPPRTSPEPRMGRDRHAPAYPEEFVLELAVWFKRRLADRRVHLRELGPPLWLQGKAPFPRLETIAAKGMTLSVEATAGESIVAFNHRTLLALVYFKVLHVEAVQSDPLTFMAGYELNEVNHFQGRLCLGLRLAFNGVPQPGEMALHFMDAREHGIADLTRWCDDLHRGVGLGGLWRSPVELRLDNLLQQLEIAVGE